MQDKYKYLEVVINSNVFILSWLAADLCKEGQCFGMAAAYTIIPS
jgi:hypothetical protein